jgi:hypothetical protein
LMENSGPKKDKIKPGHLICGTPRPIKLLSRLILLVAVEWQDGWSQVRQGGGEACEAGGHAWRDGRAR